MLETLLQIDTTVFYFVNITLSNAFFDWLMPFITNEKNWFMLYFFMFGWLLWKGGKHGRICVLVLICTIVLSDQLSSTFLKNLFERPRPCHVLHNINLLVGCGAGKSFPSSHAVNSFAAAVVLSAFIKKYRVVFYSTAALIAFSRVYVGVHYPIDIVCGAIIGFVVASIIIWVVSKQYKGLHTKKI